MKKLSLLLCMLCLSGCATKNYGCQGELTQYKKNAMTCREIALEQANVLGFIEHVEKGEALKNANRRLDQLSDIKSQKKCNGEVVDK